MSRLQTFKDNLKDSLAHVTGNLHSRTCQQYGVVTSFSAAAGDLGLAYKYSHLVPPTWIGAGLAVGSAAVIGSLMGHRAYQKSNWHPDFLAGYTMSVVGAAKQIVLGGALAVTGMLAGAFLRDSRDMTQPVMTPAITQNATHVTQPNSFQQVAFVPNKLRR